jgi:hypothetical protein
MEPQLADLVQTYWKRALLDDLAKALFRPTRTIELSTTEDPVDWVPTAPGRDGGRRQLELR